jgi:putative toxin-antitoxin system antitoxin component (TIGR02293 family)
MTIDAAEVARIMGGARVLRQRIDTLAHLQHAVEQGLPVEALDETARYVAGGTAAERAIRDQLVPRATRGRRTRLKPAESERVERLARTMALAELVWEEPEAARAFLNTPHPLLDGRTPLETAQAELGARRVEQLLMKLEYSLPV